MMNASSSDAIILVIVLTLAVALAFPILFGVLCRKLAGRKGYDGYFWTGFFLGMVGLLYVIGLPDMNIRKDIRAIGRRIVALNDRVNEMEGRRQV